MRSGRWYRPASGSGERWSETSLGGSFGWARPVLTTRWPRLGSSVTGARRRCRWTSGSSSWPPWTMPMTDAPASGERAADGPAASNPGLAPVIRLAPAKLNLTLAVLGRRPDAYHDLHSVMAPLDLADRLSVAPAAGPEDTLRAGRGATRPIADNLVLRAVAAARGPRRGQRGGPPPAA